MRCPKCKGIDLELHEDADEKVHGHGYLPTKVYYQCPSCFDTFPVYDEQEEA